MACGYTREESGAILHLSMETVAQYLKQAYSKLRTTNMAHATVVAAMIGELDAEIIRDHAFRAYELPGLAAPRRPVAA